MDKDTLRQLQAVKQASRSMNAITPEQTADALNAMADALVATPTR